MRRIVIILFFICCNLLGQQITRDTIFVNNQYPTILSFEGIIHNINLGDNLSDEIEFSDEPLFLKGKTIINVIAKKEFNQLTRINLVNEKGDFYDLRVEYTKNDFDPYYIFERKKEVEKKAEGLEKNTEEFEREAIRINSMLKKQYSTIREINNSVKIELINSYAKGNKLFLRFQITNYSAFNFIIQKVAFKTSQIDAWNKKSSPEGIINYMYSYDENVNSVSPNQHIYKTFVFESFKVADDRFFKVNIFELNSAQEFSLSILPKFINRPKILTLKK